MHKCYDYVAVIERMLNVMNHYEIDVLKKHLVAYDSSFGKRTPKSLQLVEILLENPEQLPEFADSTSQEAFKMMVSRLKSRILDSLLLDVNVNRKESDMKHARGLYLKKRLLFVEILEDKKEYKEALRLGETIASKALQSEYWDIACQAYALQQRILVNQKQEVSKVSAVSHLHAESLKKFHLVESIKGFILKWKASQYSHDDVKAKELLKKTINEIKYKMRDSQSSRIFYYLYWLQCEQASYNNNLDTALRYSNKLFRLANDYQIFDPDEIFEAIELNTGLLIKSGKLKEAIRIIKKAAPEFKMWPLMYDQLMVLKYVATIQQGKLSESYSIIKNIRVFYQNIDLTTPSHWKVMGHWSKINELPYPFSYNTEDLSPKWRFSVQMIDLFLAVQNEDYSKVQSQVKALRNTIMDISFNQPINIHRYETLLDLVSTISDPLFAFKDNSAAFIQDRIEKLGKSLPSNFEDLEFIPFENWYNQIKVQSTVLS